MVPLSRSEIGIRIRALREERELSQQQIAEVLGIPRQSVSLIEQGERDLTALELDALANFLQVSFDEILAPKPVKPGEGTSAKKIRFAPQKLRNVLLFILEQVGGRPNIGETVLYKILYFCDFDHYQRTGKSITGMTYRRLQFGPAPQQSQFSGVVEEMIRHGELERLPRSYHGKQQVRYIALTEPDTRLFDEAELRTIHDVIAKVGHMSAVEIEEYVHEDTPWKATGHQQPINYELVHFRSEPHSVWTEEQLDAMLEQASIDDSEAMLDPLTKEEYDYYMSLPDLRDAKG